MRGSGLKIEGSALSSLFLFDFFLGTEALFLEGFDEGFHLHGFVGSDDGFRFVSGFFTDNSFRDTFDAFKCSLHFFWTTDGSFQARHFESDGLFIGSNDL